MIKVEIYEYNFDWENEEPSLVLSLKEFEERFNKRDGEVLNVYKIRFIVV